ncbi:MAG: response regulator [Gemmatimonadota bacterium]
MVLYKRLRTKTVALVDPDPWIRDSLSLLFQCAVCRLRAFDTVWDGLRGLETERFDIVICDYGMPGMDGIRFLTEAAARQPGAKRILIAGYPLGELADAAARAGIDGCLQKPFTLDELEKTLWGVVDTSPVTPGEPVGGTAD